MDRVFPAVGDGKIPRQIAVDLEAEASFLKEPVTDRREGCVRELDTDVITPVPQAESGVCVAVNARAAPCACLVAGAKKHVSPFGAIARRSTCATARRDLRIQ